MPKALDLTNQIFGKLTVIKKAPSRNKHTYWLCQCDCGNFKEIQTTHLTNGSIKSCGCLANNNSTFSDLTEERECILCKEKFIPNNSLRKYCYNCSPIGLSSADRQRHSKRILKHKLIQYKGGKCQKCGYDKCEGALQFHHRDPKEKEFTLSQVNLNNTNFSIDIMYKEVDKCDLLCANCHAEIHYLED